MWDVIVCTCQSTDSAATTRKELQIRQQKGLLNKDAVLLAIDDPKANIGSGSATLNALLCVAENLAGKEGLTAVSEDALFNSRILILLLGATFPFSPCGHGFMPSPSSTQPGDVGFDQTEVRTIFDDLMEFICSLARDTPQGVWVASTDMLLKTSGSPEPVNTAYLEENDIVAVTVTSTPEHAMRHGVCKLTEENDFARIIHKGNRDHVQSCIRPDSLCDILAGIVYFNPRILGSLLTLHTTPPLDACTYAGLDNGAEPLSLSLFFELLVCLTTEITREDYVGGSFKDHRHDVTTKDPVHQRARSQLWKALKGLKMRAVRLPWVEHHYLRLVASDVVDRYRGNGRGQHCVINSIVPEGTEIGKDSVLINCNLKSAVSVGDSCFLSGLGGAFSELKTLMPRIRIESELTVQEVHVSFGHGPMRMQHGIVMIYGTHDILDASLEAGGTFCNKPWQDLFQRTGISDSDLWFPNMPKTLLNARLFVASHVSMEVGVQQTFWLLRGGVDGRSLDTWRSAWRVSIAEVLHQVNCQAEFSKLRDISFELQRRKMVSVLKQNLSESFLPFLRHSTLEKKQNEVLKTLDQVAQEVTDQLIVCRVYASIADMLSYMAGEGGIRAGPAANVAWRSAFSLLEKRDFPAATRALALERSHWINNGPDRVIRAARHYERAGQILTRLAVSTARQFIKGIDCPAPAINHPITVLAPARIDLAGAWTDTPPQAFEHGGSVTTLALRINGEYPIRVTAERIKDLKLVLVLLSSSDGDIAESVEVTELSQMANYSQPHAPGALLKAAFICASIVEFPSDKSLAEQLGSKFGCGFKIQSLSDLPVGSGLGTSSILGGAIMAALWRVAGQEHSEDSLIHAVLHLEQLLTTGGGWQDQCGGLYGGAKISHSKQGLPVHITTRVLQVKPGFLEMLSQHLLLVYTGKTRLARNLLQDVLRNWHSREDKIVQNMRDIYQNSEKAAAAVERGDMEAIGECLNSATTQKSIMAPGSLPKTGAMFIKAIKNEIYGCVFAGAGGGGFISVLTKGPASKEKIQSIINSNKELNGFVLYDATVDEKGLHFV